MYFPTTSLTDPPLDSPIADGVAWIQAAALGSTATVISVTAVAAVGLLMLSGRLELKRGIAVIIGCFTLFGAGGVAMALTGIARADDAPVLQPTPRPDPLSNQARSAPSPAAYDPYAGASVPQARHH
ncbi:TrbC/VirB2 family protein [Sphingopyxis sp. NFH-91]|uniref:TrbC/VirB2 family protein n=1 Tax=Sphingopyxis sp. NFH-91 TaxID=2744457 RepID=UPI001F2E89CD|nr:TrbC/VirB2 family protein [Sphingopyxis sp. NFH-91]